MQLGDIASVNVEDLTHGSKTLVKIQCDYCGDIIQSKYKDYMKHEVGTKYACPHCRGRRASEVSLQKRRNYLFDGISKVCNENGYTLLTNKNDIDTAETRVEYECPKHGINETKLYSLFLGHICPRCAIEKNTNAMRHTPDEVEELFNEHGCILLNKDEYHDWNCKNLKILCPECGEMFITSYGAFKSHGDGQICPKCSQTISMGEHSIKEYLDNNNIQYKMEYRFDDCRTRVPLPFDFYIPALNTCIEYDGEHHYKPIQRVNSDDYDAEEIFKSVKQRDEIKTNYCKDNNINLIRIPYWDYNNIQQILDNTLFT